MSEKFDWKTRLGIAVLLCIGQMLLQKIALDTGNLTIHIPLIRYFENKAHFIDDPLQPSFKYFVSYFYYFLSYLHISDSFIRPFFAINYFIFGTAITYTLFLIWGRIRVSQKFLIWSGVLLAAGYLPSLGASNWMWEFTHQMPAILLILLAFYFLLDDRFIISAIFLGIGFNIHLVFTFPAIIIWASILLYNRKYRYFIIGLAVIVALATPTLVWILKLNIIHNQETMIKILHIRSFIEMFPLHLGTKWIPFLVFFIIVMFQTRKRWQTIKKWATPLIVSNIIFISLAIFGEITKNIFLIRMQVPRGTVFFVLVFFPFFIEYIFEQFGTNMPSLFCFYPAIGMQPPVSHISLLFPMIIKKKSTLWILGIFWLSVSFIGPILVWKNFVSAEQVKNIVLTDFRIYSRFQLLVLMLGVGLIFKLNRKIKLFPIYVLLLIAIIRSIVGGPFTVQDKQWVDIQKWAEENTSPDAIFLTPPTMDGFRVYSRRSIVFDWKSGPGVDLEWWKRLQDFHPMTYTPRSLAKTYKRMSRKGKIALANKYNAEYIVVSNSDKFAGKPLYSNSKWSIYKSR